MTLLYRAIVYFLLTISILVCCADQECIEASEPSCHSADSVGSPNQNVYASLMDSVELSAESLNLLSIRELKNLLLHRKIDCSDCLYKADLVKKLMENPKKVEDDEENILGSGVSESHSTIASLDCIVVGLPTKKPDLVVVFR